MTNLSTYFDKGNFYDTSDGNITVARLQAGDIAYTNTGRISLPPSPLIDYKGASATTTDITVDVPSHEEGDIFVMVYVSWVRLITGYTGWTQQVHTELLSNDWFDVYTRVATASEPASYTFTCTGSAYSHSAMIACFRGFSSIGTVAFNNKTPQETPSVTGTDGGLYVGMAGNIADSVSMASGITGLTLVGVQEEAGANKSRVCIAFKQLTAAGATGAFTPTWGAMQYDGYAGIPLNV